MIHAAGQTTNQETFFACADKIRALPAAQFARELASVLGLKRRGDLQDVIRDLFIAEDDPEVVDALIQQGDALETPPPDWNGVGYYPYLPQQVSKVLAEVRNPLTVSNLVKGLDAKSDMVAAGCSQALWAIGTPEAVQGLLSTLGHAGGVRREYCLEAVTGLKNPAVLPELQTQLARQTDPQVRQAIQKAITAIQQAAIPKP